MSQTRSEFLLDDSLERLFADSGSPSAVPPAGTHAFACWQRKMRTRVEDLLGISGLERPEAASQNRLHVKDRGAFAEEKWDVLTSEGIHLPVYFLVPRNREMLPPVLTFHGHNPSAQYILGNYPDRETAVQERKRHGNYAERLAEAGHFVCVVEQRGFGERQSSGATVGTYLNSCRHLSFYYQMLGRTMVGERCRDGMVALDLLRARPECGGSKVAVTGNSGGGTTTLWLSAIEESLDVAITGCYFCSFRESIMGIRHCECNYVPGAAREFEMGELACLTAPRPQLFIQGEYDDIFPIAAVREQFEVVREAYAGLNLEDRVEIAVHPTGHAYNADSALAFLEKWM